MTWREIQREAVAHIACTYCHAPAGQPCVSKGGGRVSYGAHARRAEPIQQAWLRGYAQGEGDVMDGIIAGSQWVARRIERRRQGAA